MANKAYKFRIYPNKEQEELIQKTFGCVRFVYNHFLEDRIKAYKERGESQTYYKQAHALVELKKELSFLIEPDKNALQYALKDLNAAYQNFFRRVKKGGAVGPPRFKSKKNDRKSYTTSANGKNKAVRIEGKYVVLPKLGRVKYRDSRQIPSEQRITTATVSQNPSGKYFVSLSVEYDFEPPFIVIDENNALGLDYSSPHFYVDSEGHEADMPHFYREAQKKLAKEQRKLSRMVKGSNNYQRQRIKVARMFEKVANCRNDWQHKESTRLADKYDLIAVEDINMQGMARGLHLAKATTDNGFGQFRTMIAYKLAERGKKLVTIDKWFPSSKTCRFCGYVNADLKLGQGEWTCPSCGAHLMRDHNAAINIKVQGLAIA